MRLSAADALSVGAAAAMGMWFLFPAPRGAALDTRAMVGLAAALAVLAGLPLRAAERRREAADREAADRRMRSQLAALEERVRAQADQLREMATTDEVTGVLKRVELLRRLEEAVQRASRTGRPCALLLVDIQGFEEINAARGGTAGDEALREVARALCSVTRGTDAVGRGGADEFAVVLGECDDPRPVVGRLLVALDAARAASEDPPLRVHVGGAHLAHPPRNARPGDLLQAAADALSSLAPTGESRFCCRSLEAGAGSERSPVRT